jgi:hypothetical protein
MILQTLSMLSAPISPKASTSSMYFPMSWDGRDQINKPPAPIFPVNSTHLDTDITQTDRSLPLFIMHDLASFLLLGATLGWNRSFLCFCEWIDSQSSGAVEAEIAGGSGMGLGVCSLRGPIAAMVSSSKSYICQ